MYYKPILFFAIFLFGSCGSAKESLFSSDNGKVIVDLAKTVTIDPVKETISENDFLNTIKDIQYIPLKTNKESLIAEIDKVIDFEGYYYVMDKKTATIFVFDSKGNLARKLQKKGEGPGEYLSLNGFDIDKDKKQLLVYSLDSHKVIAYTLSLDYLHQSKFLFYSHNFIFEPTTKQYVFFTQGSIYKEGKNYNLIFTDEKGKVKNNFFDYTFEQYKNFIINLETGSISQAHKGIIYNEGFSDTIFVSNGEVSESRYLIDFGKNKMPDEIKRDSKKFGENYKYSWVGNNIYESSQKLIFSFCYERYYYTAYFDRKSKNVIYNDRLKSSPFFILRPPIGADTKNNTFVSYLDKKWVDIAKRRDLTTLLSIEKHNQAFAKAIESIEDNDNPVLAVYSFK